MIVALGGQKGGSGKTTTAIAVAVECLRRRWRVLLVDVDPQRSACTWGAVAVEQGHPSPQVVSMGAGLHRPDRLPALAALHDVTVVDCPPRLDALQRAVLLCADLVVVPTGATAVDAWALAELLDVVGEARAVRPQLDVALLIARKRPGTVLGRRARGVLEEVGLPILSTELGDRMAYPESVGAGMGPTTYAPGSSAALEVTSLVNELDRRRPLAPGAAAPARRRKGG